MLQSVEEQLRLKDCEILEMNKVIESQIITLRETKRLLNEKEDCLSDKQKIIARLENDNKKLLSNVLEMERPLREEEASRNHFIEKYNLPIGDLFLTDCDNNKISMESCIANTYSSKAKNFYNRLKVKMAEYETFRGRVE
jgi:hypothetical protein